MSKIILIKGLFAIKLQKPFDTINQKIESYMNIINKNTRFDKIGSDAEGYDVDDGETESSSSEE